MPVRRARPTATPAADAAGQLPPVPGRGLRCRAGQGLGRGAAAGWAGRKLVLPGRG